MKSNNKIILFAVALVFLDGFIWWNIVYGARTEPELYFLNVGQGDSEMVELPPGIKILIDGGPGKKALPEVDKIVSPFDRYIDLVMLSHAQADHMEGLIEVMKRYKVGAFIWNGEPGGSKGFNDLKRVIVENKIPVVVLGDGDKIKIGENQFDVLWPSKEALGSKELNDTVLVSRLKTKNFTVLFTGDLGGKVEKTLASSILPVDILKVGHHGSKYSSSKEFLSAVNPKIAVIEVGAKNPYRHPTQEALSRLRNAGAKIFRTDLDGTIRIISVNGKLEIAKSPNP